MCCKSLGGIKTKKTSTDLTVGSIPYRILTFAMPILAGQIFQNLYNSVDSVVVGNFVGTTALRAVSSCSDISQLLIGFFTGLSAGAGILFSRYFGAKNYDRLHDAIHTALTFAGILGLAMAALGIACTPLLLKMVKCPRDVWDESSVYLRIYLVGIFFTSIYNVGAGVLRSVGNSRSPFIYLVISSVTNIILDLLLVVVFKMGVAGVGIATIFSQFVSVFLVFRNMLKTEDVYKLSLSDLKIDRELLGQVVTLGLPARVQASLISISNLFVQRYINSFGSAAMAGVGSAKKIDKFVGLCGQSIGMATATFVSQNIGAKKYDRVFKGITTAFLLALVPFIFLGTFIYTNAELAVSLFTKSPESIYYGSRMILTMLPLYIFQIVNAVYSNAVRGFGKSFVVMLLSLCGMVGVRQIFLFVTMNYIAHDIHFVYYGYPVGWLFSGAMVYLYYLVTIRSKYRKDGTPKAA